MGFTFGLVVWFPMIARGGQGHARSPYFLVIVCVYALTMLGQVSFFNSFGFDRSAAGFYFAAPQPISKTLLGKNIAAMMYIFAEALVLCTVTVALGLTNGFIDVVRALLSLSICSLYLVGIGNISSVKFPKAMAPERVSHGGTSRSFNGLMFLLYPLTMIPVALAYLARYAFDSEIAFVVVLGAAAALGVTVYHFSMESAVKTASVDRESILQELSRGDGPVISS
jgi:ABC-2 type transport system permease protein